MGEKLKNLLPSSFMCFQLRHVTVELITSLEDDVLVETWIASDGRGFLKACLVVASLSDVAKSHGV